MENITLSRKELYNMVWTKPLSRLSDEWKLTIPVLRQLCMIHHIPLPGHGYWAPRQDRSPDRWNELSKGENEELINLKIAAAEAKAALIYPGETNLSFQVPNRLSEPDPLIVNALNNLQQNHQLHGLKDMLSTAYGQMPVRASKANIDRAMRIMDTLLKCWKRRGYQVSLQDKDLSVSVRKVSQRGSLREITKLLPGEDVHGFKQYETTGLLAFKVDGWLDREWKDGKMPLETHVEEILDHMEMAACDLEQKWEENAARQKERDSVQRAKELTITSNDEERQVFEALVAEAQRWQQLRVLDDYLNELSRGDDHSPAFRQWLDWARHRRGIFDPIKGRKSTFIE